MTETPNHAQHDDPRVTAILRLALLDIDHPEIVEPYDLPGVAAAIVHHVHPVRAREAFNVISGNYADAHMFDTYGGDAVREVYSEHGRGNWDLPGQNGDEKAVELRDEARDSARIEAELLVSLEVAEAKKELH